MKIKNGWSAARVEIIVIGLFLKLPFRYWAQPTREIDKWHRCPGPTRIEISLFPSQHGLQMWMAAQLWMGSDLTSGPVLVSMVSWQLTANSTWMGHNCFTNRFHCQTLLKHPINPLSQNHNFFYFIYKKVHSITKHNLLGLAKSPPIESLWIIEIKPQLDNFEDIMNNIMHIKKSQAHK